MLGRANLVTKIHQRRHAAAAAAAAGVRLDILEVSAQGWVLDFAAAGEHIELGRRIARDWLEGVDRGLGVTHLPTPGRAVGVGAFRQSRAHAV